VRATRAPRARGRGALSRGAGRLRPPPSPSAPQEIAAKTHAATVNAGGGKEGLKDRLGGAAGHSRFLCKHCKAPLTSLVQAKIHHDAKHEKLAFLEADYEDIHEAHGGVTTQGVAVRGTTNAEKLKKRAEAAPGGGKA